MQTKKIPSLFRENALALIDSNLTDEQIKRQLRYMIDDGVQRNLYEIAHDWNQLPMKVTCKPN